MGELALPAPLVGPDTPVPAVEVLLRADDGAPWLVMSHPAGPVLLSRSWLEALQSGRYGYGRVLNQRRTVQSVAPRDTVVVAAAWSVGEASAMLAERRRADEPVPEALVVVQPDGGIGVLPVTRLFEQVAQHYAHRAVHDALTGLPNRLHLKERLLPPYDFRPSAFFFIDLDRFKDVNDHYGHAAGDDVLIQFAQRLRSLARAGDLVARLGGDEFALVTSDRLGRAEAEGLAQRILLAADAAMVVRGAEGDELVTVGASVGIAEAAEGGGRLGPDGLDALITEADTAMYRAKSLGRGRATHFTPELLEDREATEAVRARHLLERRLRTAVAGGHLTVQYQPVVALPSGRTTGVEALARWHDDELGSIPPDRFVPLAERTGLIVDLGRWVLATACREAARWPAVGGAAGPTVAVNVSPVQLAQRGFVEDVLAALEDSGLAPARLCLEITETAAITDVEATAARLEELRRLGVRLALDDFGAGHSAVSLLRRLPVDLVKIDRSFVERVATDTGDAVLVRLVIEAAHSLGKRVCAEGVETVEQARQLVAMGCDSAQGWLFGRPADVPATGGALEAATAVGVGDAAPLVLHGSDEIVVVSDPDRVVTYASANIAVALGWLPQELVGRSAFDLMHPEDADRLRRGRPLVRTGGVHGLVHRAVHRDGTVRWLRSTVQLVTDAAGAPREVVTVSRDVTEAVAAQQALAESEAMFRHAFDDAPIGMALTDLGGRFIRVNRAYAELVGRTPEGLAAMSVADVTHPEDLARDDANLAEIRHGEAGGHEVVKRYVREDGGFAAARVRAGVVLDRSGEPAYVFAHVLEQAP